MTKKRLLIPNSGRDRIVNLKLSKAHEAITSFLINKQHEGEISILSASKNAWDLAVELVQEIDKVSITIADIDLT